MTTRTSSASAAFHRLHVPGDPFLLPCAWDVACARLFAAAGCAAIGTTSLGVAAGIGAADEDRETLHATAQLARNMRSALPNQLLTCDFEDGYSDDPGAVVDIVRQLLCTGDDLLVDGINIEDSVRGRLAEPMALANKVNAIKDAFPDLFVNARIDTFWVGQDNLGEVLQRLQIYADAGADGIFVPGCLDLATIGTIVDASPLPVNVLASPDYSRSQLAGAGVARISTGSLLYRTAISAALQSLNGLADNSPTRTDNVLSYPAVAGLSGGDQPSS